jgi:hypothetical protein
MLHLSVACEKGQKEWIRAFPINAVDRYARYTTVEVCEKKRTGFDTGRFAAGSWPATCTPAAFPAKPKDRNPWNYPPCRCAFKEDQLPKKYQQWVTS